MPSSPERLRRLATVVVVVLLAIAAWYRPLDTAAEAQLDRGMKSAFAAFATARALNGVISLVQSGQVSAQVGVGMSVHPGELLDPVNDLIERFSDAMLAAAVAFGVQKVLVAVGAHWVVPALLGLAALAWVGLVVAGRPAPPWLARAIVLLLLVRFAVPLATLGTEQLAQRFLAPGEAASRQALDALRGQAEGVAQPAPAGEGTVAAIRGWIAKGADLGTQIEKLTEAAGRLSEHVTNLIVVFLLQTLVFPLALAWLMWRGALAWLRAPA
jgi:hypothetical protein